MKNKSLKNIILATALCVGLVTPTTVFAKTGFRGEYRQGEILSFGSSLNKSEESALREYFGVSKDMEAIYVDNATAIEQLGLEPDSLNNYTGGWYSSAYVKLTDKGGVNVTSKNVTLVTNEMFANALITSGILNCEVNVSAPFNVTGESALAGILAGAEEIMGESLSEENKVVAKEEIDTTLDIADEILSSSDNEINSSGESSTVASGIINDIKQQVIKDSPNSTQIQQIIMNVTNNYGVELSEETNQKVLRLMEDVNDLDIDYKDIKDTMKNIGDSISDNLKEAGIKLKESGILEKIGQWIGDLLTSLGNWIKDLFTPNENLATEEVEEVEVEPVIEEDGLEETTEEVVVEEPQTEATESLETETEVIEDVLTETEVNDETQEEVVEEIEEDNKQEEVVEETFETEELEVTE